MLAGGIGFDLKDAPSVSHSVGTSGANSSTIEFELQKQVPHLEAEFPGAMREKQNTPMVCPSAGSRSSRRRTPRERSEHVENGRRHLGGGEPPTD